MKIPEIPKIPTDNLYKFMAISQLKEYVAKDGVDSSRIREFPGPMERQVFGK